LTTGLHGQVTFDHYFTTKFSAGYDLKQLLKIAQHLATLWGKLIASNALCAGAILENEELA